jgi:hypothetical protein
VFFPFKFSVERVVNAGSVTFAGDSGGGADGTRFLEQYDPTIEDSYRVQSSGEFERTADVSTFISGFYRKQRVRSVKSASLKQKRSSRLRCFRCFCCLYLLLVLIAIVLIIYFAVPQRTMY